MRQEFPSQKTQTLADPVLPLKMKNRKFPYAYMPPHKPDVKKTLGNKTEDSGIIGGI